jgi:hypothetical protein
MKNLITFLIILTFVSLFSSCKKSEITPGNYKTVTPVDCTPTEPNYANGGTTPTNTPTNNQAIGTKWVLTYFKSGFSTPPLPSDTIRFIDNTYYTINSGAVKKYTLTSGVTLSSLSLTLDYHYPFGSGNYTGEISSTFVTDGVMYNIVFINTNSTTPNITAVFKKF